MKNRVYESHSALEIKKMLRLHGLVGAAKSASELLDCSGYREHKDKVLKSLKLAADLVEYSMCGVFKDDGPDPDELEHSIERGFDELSRHFEDIL